MSENIIPTPKDIHAELTAFTYERDQEFRRYSQDTSSIARETKKYVRTVENEDNGIPYKIYNSRKLLLEAEYDIEGTERASKASSIIFTLGLTSVKQLAQLPRVLQPYLSSEQHAYYDTVEPGYLNEMHHLEYIVRNHYGSTDTSIFRSIEYALCDNDTPIYTAKYPVSKNKFERVAVAHEQRTIVVPPHVREEQNEDIYDQIGYDATFRNILEVSSHPTFNQAEYEHDSILSIRSLLKILRSSSPLPQPNDKLY